MHARQRELCVHAAAASLFMESLTIGPLSIGRVMSVVLVVAVALTVLDSPRRLLALDRRVALIAALLIAWAGISRWWTTAPEAWLLTMSEILLAATYFAGFALLLDTRAALARVLRTFVLVATLSCGLAGLQAAAGERATGLQGDPNTFAMYQICALVVAVVMGSRGGLWGWWAWISVLALAGSVAATQSRGGALALATVLVWMMFSGDVGRAFGRVRPLAPVLLGTSLALAVTALLQLPRFDLQEVRASGGTGRRFIWQAALGGWQDHPLLGMGVGGFEASSGRLLSSPAGVGLDPRSVLFEGIRIHNLYLEVLVELGPAGLLLLLALLATVAALLWRDRLWHRPDEVSAALPMLITVTVASLFLSTVNNKMLWILVGIATVVLTLTDEPDAVPRNDSEVEIS